MYLLVTLYFSDNWNQTVRLKNSQHLSTGRSFVEERHHHRLVSMSILNAQSILVLPQHLWLGWLARVYYIDDINRGFPWTTLVLCFPTVRLHRGVSDVNYYKIWYIIMITTVRINSDRAELRHSSAGIIDAEIPKPIVVFRPIYLCTILRTL